MALDPAPESLEAAQAAGLRFMNDGEPGIRREHTRRGFRYKRADGAPIRDARTLDRVKALAIPPAWTDVWICPSPHGHIQAVGRDARDRKQYRYHERWRAVRDASKFERLVGFGLALTRVRARVKADLARVGLPRERVLAAIVGLLDQTLLRIGNEEYARENGSFGLTTLRSRHLSVRGTSLLIHFRGKSGKEHRVGINDRRLARVVRGCQELPGQELFQYLDEEGQRRAITSEDVNTYLREVTGEAYSAKDFRTWGGTVQAGRLLAGLPHAANEIEARHAIVAAIKQVAVRLGNTPAVCRACYVHPAVLDAFENGTLAGCFASIRAPARLQSGLSLEELAVLRLLRRGLPRGPRRGAERRGSKASQPQGDSSSAA